MLHTAINMAESNTYHTNSEILTTRGFNFAPESGDRVPALQGCVHGQGARYFLTCGSEFVKIDLNPISGALAWCTNRLLSRSRVSGQAGVQLRRRDPAWPILDYSTFIIGPTGNPSCTSSSPAATLQEQKITAAAAAAALAMAAV